jgi:hypothetical protein
VKLFNLHAKCFAEIERLTRIICECDAKIAKLEAKIFEQERALTEERESKIKLLEEKPKRGRQIKSTSQDSDIKKS